MSSLITNPPEQEASLRFLVCFYLIDIYKKAGRIIGTVFMGVKVAIDESQDVREGLIIERMRRRCSRTSAATGCHIEIVDCGELTSGDFIPSL
jgi:hypothetical protein